MATRPDGTFGQRREWLLLLGGMLSTVLLFAAVRAEPGSAASPLPSWHETPTKQALVEFVKRTVAPDSPDFVPIPERIVTFDHDGTLWCEQPVYVQIEFVFARIRALADSHPEWSSQEPFAAVLRGDRKGLVASGEQGLMQLMAATHTGMSVEEFQQTVADWIATAKHPRTGRPYTRMVYQPMLELLAWLRANEFKTCIVSGGGVEFMRVFAEEVYGVPPEQVIGSSGVLSYEMEQGRPVLRKLNRIGLVDDGAGKPVGIQMVIGRRPVMAFGNSDGDFQMLEWTTAGTGPRLGVIVHHSDAEREYAYDRDSRIGKLDRALDAAPEKSWIVIDMQTDWKRIFPDDD